MNCKDATISLGVYLVGALDPAERAEVDAHLRECAQCRAQLADLAMLPEMLDKLSLDDVAEVVPVPIASEGLYARVAAQARVEAEALDDDTSEAARGGEVHELRRRPRWQVIAAAAAAVIAIAGSSVVAVDALQSSSTKWHDFAAAHGSVQMQVGVSSQATGTALRVTVSGLPVEEHCRLVAVSDDGSTDLVGQWDATYAGEAQVTGSTSIPSGHLTKLVLYGTNGGTLVTVPV